MDKFDIVWHSLWSDYFMSLHQFNRESNEFVVIEELAQDFKLFINNILQREIDKYYSDEEKGLLIAKITQADIVTITEWVLNFNENIRISAGLNEFPDLFLGGEHIRSTTIDIYANYLLDFIEHINKNKVNDREKIASWAISKFHDVYEHAKSESLKHILNENKV